MNFAQVLSPGQIEQVHHAAEEVLEGTGFKVMDDEALRRCAAAGARVGGADGIVRLPREMLRALIEQAPSSYTIAGLDGTAHEVGGGTPGGLAIVTDPWIIDYDTRRPRRPCLEDLRRHTIIAQRMGHVAGMSRMDYPVTDVEGPASSLRAWEMHLLHTAKHHWFIPATPASNRQWLDIVRILARGGEPRGKRLFTACMAVKSPLTVTDINADLIRLACDHDAPVYPTVCPMAGSTGPHSLASMLVLGHAENLFVAALTQILKPGHPVIYAFGPSIMEMRSGHDLYYTLDKVLWKIAAVQLAHYCKLPAVAECGGTMTWRYDPQNGMEGSMFMLAAVASGADLLAGFGSCYCAMGMSAEMMVIQEAWMEAAQFLARGLRTDELHLGVANIAEAGPDGSFLTDDLTLRYMRGGEFFANDLFDLSAASVESPGMLERAHEKVEALVADFESPVPHDVQENLRRYFHDECARLEA